MSAPWPEVALGEVCDVQIGKTPPRARSDYWGPGHPWLFIGDMNQGRDLESTSETITNRAVSECNGRLVVPGTVLLSFKLSIGKVGIARRPMYTNEAIAHLPAIDGGRLESDYLYRALENTDLAGRVDRAAMGATLNKEKLKRITIPLPPIEEQRRIAAILDQADELRAKRRTSLALLDSLTESIFLDTFGDPHANPNGWHVRDLAEVVAPGAIVTYGIVQAGEEFPGGVPYIRTGDLVDGRISSARLRHTNPEIAARFARSRVRAGEIVMSIRATVGTAAIVPDDLDGANLTQGTARISPGPETDASFLFHLLRTPAVQRWIQRQVKGATFREITLKRLRELPVVVPPAHLQQRFADRILCHQRSIETAEESAQQLDSLFASLQQRAFAGGL